MKTSYFLGTLLSRKLLIPTSEERRDPPWARSWRPSEVGTKGLIPRPFRAGKSERSEHKTGAGLALRLIPFIYKNKVINTLAIAPLLIRINFLSNIFVKHHCLNIIVKHQVFNIFLMFLHRVTDP